jgi:hypothetical protein
MAGLGSDFIRPDVLPTLQTSAKQAADAVVDLILRGLAAAPPTRTATTPRGAR